MKPGFEMKSIWLQNWPLTMMLEVFQFGEGYCWRLLNSSNVPEHIWSLDIPQWRILFLGNGLTHWLPLGVKEWCKISFGINELILGEALGCIKIFQYFFFFCFRNRNKHSKCESSEVSCQFSTQMLSPRYHICINAYVTLYTQRIIRYIHYITLLST